VIPFFDLQGRVDVAMSPPFLLPPTLVLKGKSNSAKWSLMQEMEDRSTGCEPMGTVGQGERGKGIICQSA
jgi:hypothetical protein